MLGIALVETMTYHVMSQTVIGTITAEFIVESWNLDRIVV